MPDPPEPPPVVMPPVPLFPVEPPAGLVPIADGNNEPQPPKALAATIIARDATLREVKDIPGLLNAN
jgi:hypothetical protein